MARVMSQRLSVNGFEQARNISKFEKSLKKVIMKKVMKDIFLKLMFNILKNYISFTVIYNFYLRE